MARLAVDAQFAANKRRSLSHAGVPEAWSSWFQGGIESNAIVVHRKLESAIDKTKADFYRACARMTGGVPQRLLRDAVQTERYWPRRLIETILGSEIDWNRLR